jgi:enoyl-CoA hydratase/carnithine racemase
MSDLHRTVDADGVCLITINRPDRSNALSDRLLFDELPAMFDMTAKDETVRAVVLTGSGRAFCAGADLESDSFNAPDPATSEDLCRRAHHTLISIRNMRVPSVAAVNGAAVGAGLGLALACDIRYASPTARFGAPFVRMGLTPDYGATYLLPRTIGVASAMEMLTTGRIIDATEADQLRLVNSVKDDPLATAMETARAIAAHPVQAVRATRTNTLRSLEMSLEAEILDQEPRSVAIGLHSREFRERFAAYRASIGNKTGSSAPTGAHP